MGMRTTISCAHCGKPGHTARECWIAHPELKPEGRNKMNGGQDVIEQLEAKLLSDIENVAGHALLQNVPYTDIKKNCGLGLECGSNIQQDVVARNTSTLYAHSQRNFVANMRLLVELTEGPGYGVREGFACASKCLAKYELDDVEAFYSITSDPHVHSRMNKLTLINYCMRSGSASTQGWGCSICNIINGGTDDRDMFPLKLHLGARTKVNVFLCDAIKDVLEQGILDKSELYWLNELAQGTKQLTC